MPVIDYLATFPIKGATLPPRLRALLTPVGMDPIEQVEVTNDIEIDDGGSNTEYVHMLMAVVPETTESPIPVLRESADGVVSYSVPTLREKGSSAEFTPSMSGYDYIVASWGDGSHYTYSLAEKVWMALGLSPRCLGNDEQRIVYDDLGIPEFAVAEGELAREYYFKSSRNVTWRMSNAHLRKYLWMRGGRGVRSFFYQVALPDSPELRSLMANQKHASIKSELDWYEIDIREHEEGFLLLQVWASVDAVSCEMCPERSADNLTWPGVAGPVTHASANRDIGHPAIYLDDRFLSRYEQSSFYDTTPVYANGRWLCSPSYRGQWSFTDCKRVGRNLIRVGLRELYKPKPGQEILHAHSFSVDPLVAEQFDSSEEHIAAKTQRFLDAILTLGRHLSQLGTVVGENKSAEELVGFSLNDIRNNGWLHYPKLSRLAHVAPLSMSEHEFLARCKRLHELWQVIPNGFLKRILQSAGCPKEEVAKLGSVKLLQSILNVAEQLDIQDEDANAFKSPEALEGWNSPNSKLGALFVNYDLRIADAHETFKDALPRLQDLGFDTASLQQGYGRATDFVMDKVIEAFDNINLPLSRILAR